ncbi:hypothetical protein Hte_009238 [Hypoxylon texense]
MLLTGAADAAAPPPQAPEPPVLDEDQNPEDTPVSDTRLEDGLWLTYLPSPHIRQKEKNSLQKHPIHPYIGIGRKKDLSNLSAFKALYPYLHLHPEEKTANSQAKLRLWRVGTAVEEGMGNNKKG